MLYDSKKWDKASAVFKTAVELGIPEGCCMPAICVHLLCATK